ncbi:MAG TPA: hypothetical protein VKA18_05215 [Alphaproteobacteria bacterium]|nr:hypothetical protein [Alphaproteobacteria bacterium]
MNMHTDLRLPDAVTVKGGPITEIASFLLRVDKIARERGIRLRVRTDIDELVALNRRETERGNWYPLFPIFDPACNAVDASNAYWISGINDAGETVVAQAGRLFDWRGTTLADEMESVLYAGTPEHPPFHVRCPAAHGVSGTVCFSGSTWFHPDYRRLGLSRILPRVSRVFAYSNFDTDWTISMVKRELVEKNIAAAYGYTDIQFGIWAPGHPLGNLDLALVRMPRAELLSDLRRFVAERGAVGRQVA